MIYKDLVNKEKKMAVIGLGYVGLPIALEFARKISVIGFDIKPDRIELMKNKVDPSNELEAKDFEGCDITFTSSIEDIREASFYIVAVPTPIDVHKKPDLTPVMSATETVGSVLAEGDYVVYESTVYPGCTEEDCIPLLSAISGLKYMEQFKVGFSPERINPGDRNHTPPGARGDISVDMRLGWCRDAADTGGVGATRAGITSTDGMVTRPRQ